MTIHRHTNSEQAKHFIDTKIHRQSIQRYKNHRQKFKFPLKFAKKLWLDILHKFVILHTPESFILYLWFKLPCQLFAYGANISQK